MLIINAMPMFDILYSTGWFRSLHIWGEWSLDLQNLLYFGTMGIRPREWFLFALL